MGSVLLVRHAEAAHNLAGRAPGRDDPPLTALGRAQAQRVAEALASVPFAMVLSSDARRAVETAAAILAGRSTPLIMRPALREIDHGVLAGLSAEAAERDHPDDWRQLLSGAPDVAPTGGETLIELLARVRPVANEVRCAARTTDVLLVAHAGSLRAVLLTLLDLPIEGFWRLGSAVAGISEIAIHGDTAVLGAWNDTSHLAGLADAPGAGSLT